MLRLLLAGLFALALSAPAPAAEPADPGLRIGMVQGMFRDVQPAMVQALSRPLRDLIQKQTGLTGDVEIVPDSHILADRIKAKKYDLGVFHGFEFAWAKKKYPDLTPICVTVPPGRKLQALIVVHVDSKLTTVADLKDEPVIVPRGTKAHCLLFHERLRATLPAGTAVGKTKPAMTAEEALDAIVQQDATAALVDIGGLTGYQSIQPGAFKQLRILAQSDPFPQTVIAYSKGSTDEATVGQVRKLLTDASQTAAGKPLLMLWSLKGFEDVPADYDLQLEKIAKTYPAAPITPVTTAGGMSEK